MTGDPELDEEMQAEIDEIVEEFKDREKWQGTADEDEEESNLPRYQIQVHLINDADVP
jgi:hypothetical protein